MSDSFVGRANQFLEKSNAELQPELLSAGDARELMREYDRAERLASFGKASLAARLDNAAELAKVTGTSLGKARETVATGKVMSSSSELNLAIQQGAVSLDQAGEIARAEEVAPGSAKRLLGVAKKEAFQVLRDKARATKLEAEQHKDLGKRQKEARCARSYLDPLGMVNLQLRLQPQVGTPIVARAEAEAQRLYRAAKKAGKLEPFERHLADAFAKHLAGKGKGRTTRAELVVLVSHSFVKRGWKNVRPDEHCKIPGVGPVTPEVAKEIAQDAFLNGVFYDGEDLRHFKRWGRYRPKELQVALELGDPPDFDGVKCIRCGSRFRPQVDHREPCNNDGPTALGNLDDLCQPCHKIKTEEDRKAGKLKPKPKPKKRKPPDR